ncbi:hypothetical protein BJV82DRAFT_666031 [Fennellomyces sp. T-0311]|nr:hypothetical protein BJV82DRAFT_666031 [Fennellomyces sp. T-0311]
MDSSYPVPEIEICAQNSTLTIARCDLMYMNWTFATIPDCYHYIKIGNLSAGDPSRCYLFQSNGTFSYGVVENYEPTSPDIRRIDIYWKVDALQNLTYASISVPSIAVELYNPGFSRWNPPDPASMIPQQAQFSRDMVLGNSRSTTTQNTTTTIFFAANKYRAIRPRDVPSLLGFTPSFVDIPTLQTNQLDWPIQRSNANLTRGDYHGLFSVQLAKATQETEQRQHTLLAAVALAGGAYGVLTTLYILLFGMIRMAPFGAVHQLPLATIRGVEKIKNHRRNSREGDSNHKFAILHRFFRRSQPEHLLDDVASSPAKSDSGSETKDSVVQHHNILVPPALAASSDEGSSRIHGPWERDYHPSSDHVPPERVEGLFALCEQLQREQRDSAAKAAQLEQRLFELQEVLRAYYINMDYLDQQRNLRRRGRQRSVYYTPQRSGSADGGWLFDDEASIHKNAQ